MKKNALEKFWLKISDKKGYKQYKRDLQDFDTLNSFSEFHNNLNYTSLENILQRASGSTCLNAVHSGNAGDIIYSLATLRQLYISTQKPLDLYLKLDQPSAIPTYFSHPLGNVTLNHTMAGLLIPLIRSQPYINKCEIFSNQEIHIDLDLFRKSNLLTDRGDIVRWYSYFTGINPKPHESWIFVTPNSYFNNHIVVSRSSRYRNPSLDFSFLKKYPHLLFVGVTAEFEAMQSELPGLRHLQVANFLELAEIIAGCKFFIGNQSFPFSLAEGLKVPRILETYMLCPNVIPCGELAYDFLHQDHFEQLVQDLYSR